MAWGLWARALAAEALAGAREGVAAHRAVLLCARRPALLAWAATCCALSFAVGFGARGLLELFLIPGVGLLGRPVLAAAAGRGAAEAGVEAGWEVGLEGFMQGLVASLFHVFCLVPAHVISFALNLAWYHKVADEAWEALQAELSHGNYVGGVQLQRKKARRQGLGAAAEEAYRALLFCFFVLQALACSALPRVGGALGFMMWAWLYAYFSFDYKWALSNWSFEQRVHFFEGRWLFMLGFGTPCALVAYAAARYAGAAGSGALFPLFITLAMTSGPAELRKQVAAAHGQPAGFPGRLRVFAPAGALVDLFVAAAFRPSAARRPRAP